MIKRTPSRNHRSKGIKLKHVLQIILLLCVCFWLIYQIKHSHDKKKEFDENDAKASARMQTADQIIKLGRKDPQPLKDDVIQTDRHEEKEEDENTLEDERNMHEHDELEEEGSKHETGENLDKHGFREQDEEEEESKHGAEEEEEEENKNEQSEDDGRGGGDEETEENDQEKPEVDIDRDEELMDEDKEKETEEHDEKENENGEDEDEEKEKEGSVENKNTHEAREEHYMADDASSAVAHDTQTTSSEALILSGENSNENSEMSIMKQENKPNYMEESDANQNDSGKITEIELKGGNVLNATGKDSGNTVLSNSVDSSNVNTTATANSTGHLEVGNNRSVVITEAINNSTGDGVKTPGSSEQNKMAISSESEHSHNTAVDVTANGGVKNEKTEELEQSDRVREDNLLNNTSSPVSVKTGNEDATAGESSNSGAGDLEKTVSHIALNETQNNSRNFDAKENIDASVDEKLKVLIEMAERNVTHNISDAKENKDDSKDEKSKDDTQMDSTDGNSDSSSVNGGSSDAVEHDAIDASDTHIHKDVTEVQTNLETLPDIRNEGNILDENALPIIRNEVDILDENVLPDIRNEGHILDETAAE